MQIKEGIYKAYFSGWRGSTCAFFTIKGGQIRGLDWGGVQYTGTFSFTDNNEIVGASFRIVRETAPSNISQDLLAEFSLPDHFLDGEIHMLLTPIGDVGVSFEFYHEC
ncbi:MAG: hypothetical protein HPY59_18925 [Anaerolineae bacterium]|nr:hypothetical protein [Anaerolineae bacterium]